MIHEHNFNPVVVYCFWPWHFTGICAEINAYFQDNRRRRGGKRRPQVVSPNQCFKKNFPYKLQVFPALLFSVICSLRIAQAVLVAEEVGLGQGLLGSDSATNTVNT